MGRTHVSSTSMLVDVKGAGEEAKGMAARSPRCGEDDDAEK